MVNLLIYQWGKGRCLTFPDEELRVLMTIWAISKSKVNTAEKSGVGGVDTKIIGCGAVNG